MAIDWEGMYSTLSREKFRILLAGRHYLDTFYYGFNYSMFHYAGQQGAPIENVVDLQLLNPCVGVRFNAFFDFDIKLGALLTAQRDRSFGHSWEKPCMGEFAFRISRWGLSLDERLYVGDNIHPFFYGHECTAARRLLPPLVLRRHGLGPCEFAIPRRHGPGTQQMLVV